MKLDISDAYFINSMFFQRIIYTAAQPHWKEKEQYLCIFIITLHEYEVAPGIVAHRSTNIYIIVLPLLSIIIIIIEN